MAIKKDYTDYGFTIKNAYIKVESFSGTKSEIYFTVSVRVSESGDPIPISENRYKLNYNLLGSNVVEQAYIYLKSLPKFSGAIDC